MAGMVTWYDVLGVLPGASPGQVQSAYQARARLLDLQMLSGASSKVLKAADAARAAMDEAWRVLHDAATRSATTRRSAYGTPAAASTGPGRNPPARAGCPARTSPQPPCWRHWLT
jgi:curved DNA-binding protein CbpA